MREEEFMRVLLAMMLCGAAFAQTQAPPVIGMLNYIHATANLERTVAFYHDVFGLEKPNPPRPPNPAVPALVNAPGAKLQVAVFKITGAAFGWELTHFGGIGLRPGQARPTDPGAADLMLQVRDLDTMLEALKKAGAPIVSRNGAPVQIDSPGGRFRSVMVRDPDGYLVEVDQGAAGQPAAGNILGAVMGLTVGDMEATLKFYRNLLGFDVTGKMEFTSNKAMLDLVGAPDGATFREMTGNVPGTRARIEFYEFKGVPRRPFNRRIPDPGTPAIALRVTDLDGLLKSLKAAGVKVISAGGRPAQFSPTIRNVFVQDPNGFKVELFQMQ
jgi:catechol 2,3-dioxygenase-like lactoylglutathione lyase family enzyme